MPVEVNAADFLRLGLATEDEIQAPKKLFKRLKQEGIVRSYRASSGLYMLEQKNGRDCYFLGADRLCTVYEKRPSVCRDFPSLVGPRVGFCPYRKK
jgi:Fe-S-cluster containining protein